MCQLPVIGTRYNANMEDFNIIKIGKSISPDLYEDPFLLDCWPRKA